MLTGRSNAFIFPVVYFFFPETRYRSLEEMDAIFAKSGWFSCVPIAAKEPHRFDKNGNLLISYLDTQEHQRRESVVTGSRKGSVAVATAANEKADSSS